MRAFVTGGSGFVGRNLIPYLVEHGWEVRALARSPEAGAAVRASGAEPATGDITSSEGLADNVRGCDAAFHAAAWADDWGDPAVAWNANVVGTERMLTAAREAGVKRFVHVSTEAVLVGAPIVRATEDWPYPTRSLGLYTWTKREAEKLAKAASAPGFDVMVVRPRLIWGKGDTTLTPRFVEAAKSGTLKWLSGGRYLTSTCHVRNCCEGMLKAAEKGAPGEIYFLTDGEPVAFREIISALLKKEGVDADAIGSIPAFLAHASSIAMDAAWRLLRLKGRPPLPHASFHLMGEEVTVVDAKARKELGYAGEVTIAAGLAEIPQAS